jgi:hypothetical protein
LSPFDDNFHEDEEDDVFQPVVEQKEEDQQRGVELQGTIFYELK